MSTHARAQALVDDLTAADVSATTDPAGAVPPCVLVPPPVRRYDLGHGYTIVWTIYALAPGQGGAESWQTLDDLVDQVADVVQVEQARPAQYRTSAEADPVPAYAITIEEASYQP
jgi:hypothetical protein